MRIAALFGLTEAAVRRHRDHVAELVEQAAAVARSGKSLLARAEKVAEKVEQAVDSAFHAEDLLPAAAEARQQLRFVGELNGEIKPMVIQNLFVSLGTTEERVRFLVERDREMADYSLDDAERDLLEAWSLIRESDPERADRIRSRILGGVDAEMADVVEAAVDE